MKSVTCGLWAASMALLSTCTVLADDAPSLPGGASAINEAHSDWTLRCGPAPAAVESTDKSAPGIACAVSQQQVDKKTNKRVLVLALSAADGGGVKGSLVMPFGLALDSGVTLQIDDGPVTNPIHFRTCVPAGCIVPLEWAVATVKALGSAQSLKVAAVADGGQPAPFTISMKGFSSALDRAVSLTQKK